jgi:hypothetical protein
MYNLDIHYRGYRLIKVPSFNLELICSLIVLEVRIV